jgi:hypothetical protein
VSDTNREPVYQGLSEPIEPGSPNDWRAEQLDQLSANRKPHRVLQPDGTLNLTREEAVHIVAALLFYLRAWDEDPANYGRSVPTRQLIADEGRAASEVLAADIFPAEVVHRAIGVWDERWSNQSRNRRPIPDNAR